MMEHSTSPKLLKALAKRLKTLTFIGRVTDDEKEKLAKVRLLGNRFRHELNILYPDLRGNGRNTYVVIPESRQKLDSINTAHAFLPLIGGTTEGESKHLKYDDISSLKAEDVLEICKELPQDCEHLVLIIPNDIGGTIMRVARRLIDLSILSKGLLCAGDALILHFETQGGQIMRWGGPSTIS